MISLVHLSLPNDLGYSAFQKYPLTTSRLPVAAPIRKLAAFEESHHVVKRHFLMGPATGGKAAATSELMPCKGSCQADACTLSHLKQQSW